jgi:hypothetical protein
MPKASTSKSHRIASIEGGLAEETRSNAAAPQSVAVGTVVDRLGQLAKVDGKEAIFIPAPASGGHEGVIAHTAALVVTANQWQCDGLHVQQVLHGRVSLHLNDGDVVLERASVVGRVVGVCLHEEQEAAGETVGGAAAQVDLAWRGADVGAVCGLGNFCG